MNQSAGVNEPVSSTAKSRTLKAVLTVSQSVAGLMLALCMTEQPAKAYADPGSGAMLWQLFFASVVSIGFNFRKIRVWLINRRPRR